MRYDPNVEMWARRLLPLLNRLQALLQHMSQLHAPLECCQLLRGDGLTSAGRPTTLNPKPSRGSHALCLLPTRHVPAMLPRLQRNVAA